MQPIMRTDEHFLEKHSKILKIADRTKLQIIFLGDSLTRRWEDNPDLWEYYFSEYNCANFGIGGDCLENILWRIQNNELVGLKPKLFIILIGTNNITKDAGTEIVKYIFEIISEIKKQCIASQILLLGILPREKDDNGNECNNKIKEINRCLKTKMKKEWGKFIDIGCKFINSRGDIRKDIMPDGLHLNYDGYKILGPLLKNEIKKLI